MDRLELSYAIQEELDSRWIRLSKRQINDIIKIMCNIILHKLSLWIPVFLHKFGHFTVTNRKSRNWINPQSFEPIIINEHRTIKFTVSKPYKKILNP